MEKWVIVSGYEALTVDGKVVRVITYDGPGGYPLTGYIYRRAGDHWIMDTHSTPAAIRAGIRRGTIKIF